MKFFVIGLGNFGSTLCTNLTRMGHEVIGADINSAKVEAIKDHITHAVCMDCTDIHNLQNIPLKDMDVVVMAIGEDFAASVLVTAYLKQLQVKKLIGRAFNDVHRTVIEALGVDEILFPEQEAAERTAKRLTLPMLDNSVEICERSAMMELTIPQKFYYQKLEDTGLTDAKALKVVAYVKIKSQKSLLGHTRQVKELELDVSPHHQLQPGDKLILIGDAKELKKILEN
ncbi:MAG: potassium channel family protein [Runella sp.]